MRRRTDIIVLLTAVLVLLASLAAYYAQLRRRVVESPLANIVGGAEKTISPADLIKPAEATTGTQVATEPGEDTVRVPQREVIVYPDWQQGPTRVEGARPVTDNADYIRPTWSPVGLDLAFTHKTNRGILITGPRRKDTRVLSTDPGVGVAPVWNIDGMSLLVREPDGQFSNIMITGEKYPAPSPAVNIYERDGAIYFQPDNEQTPLRISGSQDRFTAPQLSPDKTKAVYLGRQTGIYIAQVDGSRVISVGQGANPTWLPDSSGIVFDVPITDGTNPIDSDLWYASATGDEKTNVTKTPGILEVQPAISYDGDRVAFCSDGAIYVGQFIRPVKLKQ